MVYNGDYTIFEFQLVNKMASGFFALLDDISALMDDVASMSKIATKKTAGILGDDLAVNAEKASGFVSSREIPVLWAITKGSFLNKLIILPFAFLLSAFVPWLITLVLVLGGVYLAYEGVEKIYAYLFPHTHAITVESGKNLTNEEILELEKAKVKSAIFTDFILSVEIVIIALGSVLERPIITQVLVVSFIAIVTTIGVYGVVAVIVRMDDAGFYLMRKNEKGFLNQFGNLLIHALPWVIKSLGLIGTIALLLVSGGIFVHKVDFLHHLVLPLPTILMEFITALLVGFVALIVVKLLKSVRNKN